MSASFLDCTVKGLTYFSVDPDSLAFGNLEEPSRLQSCNILSPGRDLVRISKYYTLSIETFEFLNFTYLFILSFLVTPHPVWGSSS